MRQLFLVSLAMGLIVAAAAFVMVHDVPDSAEANHSTPGSVDTHIVHAHDDYFHPEPLTGPLAQPHGGDGGLPNKLAGASVQHDRGCRG